MEGATTEVKEGQSIIKAKTGVPGLDLAHLSLAAIPRTVKTHFRSSGHITRASLAL